MLKPDELKLLLEENGSSSDHEEVKVGSPNAREEVAEKEDPLLASVTLQSLDSQPVTKGTYFNIMVCGAAGIGKSSFTELFVKKFNFKEAST